MRNTFICLLFLFCVSLRVEGAESASPGNSLPSLHADHIMISTSDYRGTVDWYQRALDFKVVREWAIDGMPEVEVGYIAAHGFMIEVVGTPEAFQPRELPPDVFAALGDRGYVHLAFRSADVDAVARALRGRGIEMEMAPTDFPAAGVRLLFVRDNNGNLIEVVSPLTGGSSVDSDTADSNES